MHLVYAIGVTAVVVGLALWRGSLSYSGAFGAMIVGTLIFGLGGPKWGLILGLFFVTSSLLSHYKEEHKQVVAEKFEKGSQRDFFQVMANGGIAALLATLDEMTPLSVWLPLYIGIMATVTATGMGMGKKTIPARTLCCGTRKTSNGTGSRFS